MSDDAEPLTVADYARIMEMSVNEVHCLLGSLSPGNPVVCVRCKSLILAHDPPEAAKPTLCLECLPDRIHETTFGERMRYHRLAKGMSREELAKVARVSLKVVQDYEDGPDRRYHTGTLHKLIQVLGWDFL